jgi:hypothetical protein
MSREEEVDNRSDADTMREEMMKAEKLDCPKKG